MVLIWQIIFGSFAVVCFGSFVWAIKKHFVTTRRMPAGMRLISSASLISMLLQMFAISRLERVNFLFAVAAILLYAASFGLFWWAIRATRRQRLTLAFSDDEPRHLQIAGPYRFVRHPFYLSYLLFWTAGLVAVGGEWFLFFTVAAMFALYFRAARLEETKFASSPLGEDYSKYRSRTGMFFPKLLF
jgi:protein-S-isoprenylcysteine O-methyltransferase Ste14